MRTTKAFFFALFFVPIPFEIVCGTSGNAFALEIPAENHVAQTSSSGRDSLLSRPIDKWVGEQFVFLSQPKDQQKWAYLLVRPADQPRSQHVQYEECAGKTVTIISIGPRSEYGNDFEEIELRAEDGERYIASSVVGTIPNLAPIKDINYGHDRWVDKMLWYKQRELETYDEGSGQTVNAVIRKYSPVRVLDVVPGWNSDKPVRFIILAGLDQRGFVDVHLSNTNVMFPSSSPKFDDYFLLHDPREQYKWGAKIWAAIEQEQLIMGMTTEQVRICWREPDRINTTVTAFGAHEQWVYGDRTYLYFEHGVLTSWQY